MKKKLLIVSIFLLFTCYCFSVNLRGMVQGYNNYTRYYYPYTNVMVTLWYNSATPIYSYSDNAGMYYFYNIPPGNYSIQIGNYFFQYYVSGNYPWQDIPVTTF